MSPAGRHKDRVASIGCVICRGLGIKAPCEIHHIAENSGPRSDFAIVGLCQSHHTGPAGFHTMGTRAFCSAYRIPGETEYGLLVLVNEWLSRDRL
jgi:Recombination enhancement, RecA-dependent nuclease